MPLAERRVVQHRVPDSAGGGRCRHNRHFHQTLPFEARQEYRHVLPDGRQPPDPIERQGQRRAQCCRQRRSMQIEIVPPFRRRRRKVAQPGLPKARWIPVLHKAWMPLVEVRQSLGLYALPQNAVRGTSELIPLLTDDTMTKQVTAVHGNILELLAAPDTLFLQQVFEPQTGIWL